jgi:hypothetical protein
LTSRYLIALALLFVAALVQATPPHLAWTRAALERLPVPAGDRTPERAELRQQNHEAFAAAIAEVSLSAPRSPREWSALLLTIGRHESNFDTEIVAGRCKPWQCDRGRARGAFQNQRVSFNAELWDVADGNIEAQVAMADRALRRSLATCARLGVPYPAGVFRAYAGRSCSFPLRDEAARVATYHGLVAR